MKSAFAFALSMICAVSFVAAQAPADKPAAQQPAAQQPSTPATPPSSASSAAKVTFTGCLKPGTSADSWVLENAEKGSAASASAAPSSSPSAAATAGGGSKMTIALTAKPTENLKPHANHKIEVTGTVGPAASAASPSGAAGAAGAGASAAAPRTNLSVESVKMVSATCP